MPLAHNAWIPRFPRLCYCTVCTVQWEYIFFQTCSTKDHVDFTWQTKFSKLNTMPRYHCSVTKLLILKRWNKIIFLELSFENKFPKIRARKKKLDCDLSLYVNLWKGNLNKFYFELFGEVMPNKKNLYSISVIVLNPNQGGITADSKRMSCWIFGPVLAF